MPLDLLVSGGRIATLAGSHGFGWVEAVGITDGRVAFAGSAIELETRADPHTLRIEMDPDEVAIPGLTDAHLHLAEGGIALDRIDLTSSPTLDDGLARIAAANERPRRPGRLARGPRLAQRSLGRLADRRRPRAGGAGPGGRAVGPRPSRAVGQPAGAGDRRHRRRPRRIPTAGSSGATSPARRRASSTRPRPGSSWIASRRHRPRCTRRRSRGSRTISSGSASSRSTTRARCHSRRASGGRSPRTASSTSAATCRCGSTPRSDPSSSPPRPSWSSGAAIRSDRPMGRARFGWLKLFADGTLASRTAALLEPIVAEDGRPLPPGTERGIWLTRAGGRRRLREAGRRRRSHDPGPRDRRSKLPRDPGRARRQRPARPRSCRGSSTSSCSIRTTGRGSPRPGSPPRSSRSMSGPTRRSRGRCGAIAPRPTATRCGR